MNNSRIWEFDCPQFVDFAAGLDKPSPTTEWFGSSNHLKERVLSEKNKSMATPKLTVSKESRKSPFVSTLRKLKTDDEKLASMNKLPRRRSKSVGNFDVIESLKSPEVNVPRRSLSETCLKQRKKICPVTPNCLKRALNKDKAKKAKTTEELELEKISKLQNQLSQHLRLNEVNLKRLKSNKAPYVMSNFKFSKTSKKETLLNRELKVRNACLKEVDVLEHRSRNPNIKEQPLEGTSSGVQRTVAQAANLKSNSSKLQAVLNSVFKNTETSTKALRDFNNANKMEKLPPKPDVFAKYNAHKGLKFLPSHDITIPHPFSFDSSNSSILNGSFRVKNRKAHFLSSAGTSNLFKDKENIIPTRNPYKSSKKEKKCY